MRSSTWGENSAVGVGLCRVLRLQFLPQTSDFGAAGASLLRQLLHQVLQVVNLGLQLVQRCVHTSRMRRSIRVGVLRG